MVEVMIEIGKGETLKHCLDADGKETGTRIANRPYPYSYGFIMGTEDSSGDGVDCWVISADSHAPASTVRCEPFGLLEFFEDGEVDHKVLAAPIGTIPPADPELLRSELEAFILGLFTAYPEVSVKVGMLKPAKAAILFIGTHSRICHR